MFKQRNIFLLDAAGAASTGAVHLVLLAPNCNYVGVAHAVLLTLGFVAMGFCMFSWYSWLTWPRGLRAKLLIIAIANALFCISTLGIMSIYAAAIPKLVIIYWVLEAAIIAAIVVAELSIRKRLGVAASK
jgi:hypothetical protein